MNSHFSLQRGRTVSWGRTQTEFTSFHKVCKEKWRTQESHNKEAKELEESRSRFSWKFRFCAWAWSTELLLFSQSSCPARHHASEGRTKWHPPLDAAVPPALFSGPGERFHAELRGPTAHWCHTNGRLGQCNTSTAARPADWSPGTNRSPNGGSGRDANSDHHQQLYRLVYLLITH